MIMEVGNRLDALLINMRKYTTIQVVCSGMNEIIEDAMKYDSEDRVEVNS